jgi:nucleoside-diphosphate-sugar epimerase
VTRVLITGASGFIGRNLLEALDPSWDVVALWHTSASFPRFVERLRRPALRAVRCDLADAPAADETFGAVGDAFDLVFHLAARVDIPGSIADPARDLRCNALTALTLVKRVRAGHLVFVSSGAVYEGQVGVARRDVPLTPSLPYAAHKLLAESYVRAACDRYATAERATIVRFFGAYGLYEPAHKLYARLIARFATEHIPEIEVYGDGTNLIDAMWAEDACAGLLAIARDERRDRDRVWVADLAAGRPTSVDELVRMAGRVLLGREVEIRHRGVAPERNLFRGDVAELERVLGFRATTSLESGLRRYADLVAAAARR